MSRLILIPFQQNSFEHYDWGIRLPSSSPPVGYVHKSALRFADFNRDSI